jgi:hypothetical protein
MRRYVCLRPVAEGCGAADAEQGSVALIGHGPVGLELSTSRHCSEAVSEYRECDPDTIAGRLFGDEFVATATQVLHERVAECDRPGRADPFDSAHCRSRSLGRA